MSPLRVNRGHRGSDLLRSWAGRKPRLIVDTVVPLQEDLFLVDGWCEALGSAGEYELSVSSPGAASPPGRPHPLLRKRRPDVASTLGIGTDFVGFVGCVAATAGHSLELDFVGSRGQRWRVRPSITHPSAETAQYLTGSVASGHLASQVHAHVLPVVQHDARTAHEPVVETIYQWPDGLSAAPLNVVIPVYRNFDYLRNQLLSFSEPSMRNLAVSLVCDDPAITKSLLTWVRRWNAVYQVPMQILAHDRNAGFAAACNTGARAIDSEVTLLLNSDVLPALHPVDWLPRLTDPLKAGAAMTAPVLLYPDGSIQHAGMSMEPSQDFAGFELPAHRWKGMPRTALPSHPYAVPLLSGAALAINTSTYHDVGGMPTWLGKGDFEDVALSVTARQQGDLLVIPSVAWTHIEAASYDRSSESDVLLTLAKSQLFTRRDSSVVPAVHA